MPLLRANVSNMNSLRLFSRRLLSTLNGGASSTQPGFLTMDMVRKLQKTPPPSLLPEPLSGLCRSDKLLASSPVSDLMDVTNPKEAGTLNRFRSHRIVDAVAKQTNQEPFQFINSIRKNATELDGIIRAFNKLAETRREREMEDPEAFQEADGDKPDNVYSLVSDVLAEESGGRKALEDELNSPMHDHIICSSVLKKRRKAMRRHKHKKLLRARRYKTKNNK